MQYLCKTRNIQEKENDPKNEKINEWIKINKSKFSLSTRRDGDNSLDILKGGDANTVAILLVVANTIIGCMNTKLTWMGYCLV